MRRDDLTRRACDQARRRRDGRRVDRRGRALAGAIAAPATFFTRQELALVDELTEMIIPADEHSPGARAAKVAAYIDARLAEALDAKDRTTGATA